MKAPTPRQAEAESATTNVSDGVTDDSSLFFTVGRLDAISPATRTALLQRVDSADDDLTRMVAALLTETREIGDDALRRMARKFDAVTLDAIEVPAEACQEALDALDPDVRRALERAATNIERFHRAQLPRDVRVEVEPGAVVTRTWAPLERVGVYAPGGTAAYPSSVLMGVVPARAAGVSEVVVCSPPGPDGRPPLEVLAACAIAQADRVFAVGGAGAIAAMTYGTETIPGVDAIVGPGNRWVTEAKRQVAGSVVIDSPAGPSEVLVLVDETADPRLAALEMLAQAEHDPAAVCVLISTSASVAAATVSELTSLLAHTPRGEIARRAFNRFGAILTVDSMAEALAFAEAFAPEHLSLMTEDASKQSRELRNAGTTFVGGAASVAFGDYMTGANHVLPTGGRSRSFSGLSLQHFLRSYTIQEITPAAAEAFATDVALLAEAEGLPAHAEAARARAKRENGGGAA